MALYHLVIKKQYLEPDQVEARRKICQACPHRKRNQCSLCGCFIHLKTKLRSEACPDAPPRWGKQL